MPDCATAHCSNTGIRPYNQFRRRPVFEQCAVAQSGIDWQGIADLCRHQGFTAAAGVFCERRGARGLTANRPWCFTAHSLRTRREILRLQARGKLRYREGDDAVEAYIKYKRKEALHRRGAVRNLAQVAALRAPAGSVAAPALPPRSGAAMVDLAVRDAPTSCPAPSRPSRRVHNGDPVEPQIKPLRSRKAIIFSASSTSAHPRRTRATRHPTQCTGQESPLVRKNYVLPTPPSTGFTNGCANASPMACPAPCCMAIRASAKPTHPVCAQYARRRVSTDRRVELSLLGYYRAVGKLVL